jgi:hypothetical protein
VSEAGASAGTDSAVMAFSANFACKTGGCIPNIPGAEYGAVLLPIQFDRAVDQHQHQDQ